MSEHGRLIDANALMKTLGITDMDCEKCAWGSHGFCTRGGDFRDACVAIEDSPTIEERKKGKWIWQTGDIYRCSECNTDVHVAEFMGEPIYNWCPYCGSFNGGEEDG